MSVVLTLMSRNLRLFFRDRLGVFFSLLSALILFLLYALFLGNGQVEDLQQSFPGATEGEVKGFVDSWMFAGIVGITSITSGLGAMNVFVEDSASGRFRDFLVSPIRRDKLIIGYLLSAGVIALLMTTTVLIISLAYLYLVDGVSFDAGQIATIYGFVALSCVAFASLSALAVSFVRTPGAYSALSTIAGTVLGFVAGAYIPVGAMPNGVQTVINALPFMQGSVPIRQEMTAESLNAMAGGQQEAVTELQEIYGITASVGDWAVTNTYVVLILAVMTVVFTVLASLRIRSRIA
ncbi:ABC transporter permease [Arthrobacter sp. zg-Y820]|uniref:ABC transporter permease n=1 Tax=unclassified Arthrobacter TaxID=235627 RepID=UPI001E429445|nr:MULTISPECIES: ABC transporter permease [unclassified Arthrobacter]MCC9197157.1 ABC transporter permease [Arthrobacter sp. zg-Y820]MDK1280022.1 ABC transporter permease [Arthrobacter sp. zg.Y820]MDK1360841.1 ABC transporter permease [Arthrobacter sp. zg-Y1219]WIB09317.1 ABC transporter permease [Arthrobacter sp. zg-Y820]